MGIPTSEVYGTTGPADYAAAVTPSDAVDLTKFARSLYIGTGGDLTVLMPDGASVLFKAVIGGTILPVRIRRVLATGTTASNLVALY